MYEQSLAKSQESTSLRTAVHRPAQALGLFRQGEEFPVHVGGQVGRAPHRPGAHDAAGNLAETLARATPRKRDAVQFEAGGLRRVRGERPGRAGAEDRLLPWPAADPDRSARAGPGSRSRAPSGPGPGWPAAPDRGPAAAVHPAATRPPRAQAKDRTPPAGSGRPPRTGRARSSASAAGRGRAGSASPARHRRPRDPVCCRRAGHGGPPCAPTADPNVERMCGPGEGRGGTVLPASVAGRRGPARSRRPRERRRHGQALRRLRAPRDPVGVAGLPPLRDHAAAGNGRAGVPGRRVRRSPGPARPGRRIELHPEGFDRRRPPAIAIGARARDVAEGGQMPDVIGHDRRRARRLLGLQPVRPARDEPGRGERAGTHPSTGPGQQIPCRAGPQGAAHAVTFRPPTRSTRSATERARASTCRPVRAPRRGGRPGEGERGRRVSATPRASASPSARCARQQRTIRGLRSDRATAASWLLGLKIRAGISS